MHNFLEKFRNSELGPEGRSDNRLSLLRLFPQALVRPPCLGTSLSDALYGNYYLVINAFFAPILHIFPYKFLDRLTARGNSERKRRENLECQILGTVADEAQNSYNGGTSWTTARKRKWSWPGMWRTLPKLWRHSLFKVDKDIINITHYLYHIHILKIHILKHTD
jgi:hypothetical protein